MKVTTTKLPGVVIIEPVVHGDARGFFLESYHQQRYLEAAQIDATFVQDNQSRSARNVLRGLHFQRRKPQGKLIRVAHGEVFDVAVDINPDSKTFRQWVGVTLSAELNNQFYIPPGYAHGFLVLSEYADFLYKCTAYYDPEDETGVRWNDPEIAVEWPLKEEPLISERDHSMQLLSEMLA